MQVSVTASADSAAPAETIHYAPERHGTFEAFRLSEDFQTVNAQMRTDVAALVAFIGTHEPSRADHVSNQFNTFFENLDAGAFGDLVDTIYRHGLPALHEAALMVSGDSAAIGPDDKARAIMQLADGVTVCAPGVTANLAGAARDLALGAGGLREKVWKAKEQMVEQMLQGHLSGWYQRHIRHQRDQHRLLGDRESELQAFYRNNEIHFVSEIWDWMADRLGLPEKKDPLCVSMPFAGGQVPEDFKTDWLESIRDSLKPSVIAMTLAEEMLSMYQKDVQKAGMGLEGQLDPDTVRLLADVARATSERLGFPADQSLNLYSLVAIEDTGYRVRCDPAPLAVEILARMDKLGLIAGQPVDQGRWTEKPGGPVFTLFVYEELAWKVEGFVNPLQRLEWRNVDRWEAQPVILKDLHDWSEAQKEAPAIPPEGALRHVIAKTLPDVCLHEIPNAWVTENATHQALRDQLGLGLAAYASHIEPRWPAQLNRLIKECKRDDVQLPALYESYMQAPGAKVLPPIRLVMDCYDRTCHAHRLQVLKHWPSHPVIDRWLRSRMKLVEWVAFTTKRFGYLGSHKWAPIEWPTY